MTGMVPTTALNGIHFFANIIRENTKNHNRPPITFTTTHNFDFKQLDAASYSKEEHHRTFFEPPTVPTPEN